MPAPISSEMQLPPKESSSCYVSDVMGKEVSLMQIEPRRYEMSHRCDFILLIPKSIRVAHIAVPQRYFHATIRKMQGNILNSCHFETGFSRPARAIFARRGSTVVQKSPSFSCNAFACSVENLESIFAVLYALVYTGFNSFQRI